MYDLFDETLDDLKSEKSFILFKKFLRYAVIGLASGLFVIGGYMIFSKVRDTKIINSAHVYFSEPSAADAAPDDSTNYAALLHLKKAREGRANGDLDAALASLSQVADNKDYGKVFREIACLEIIAIGLNKQPNHTLLEEIDRYLKDEPTFKYTALELKANIMLKLNKTTEGQRLLKDIANDKHTPEAIAERARSILTVVN